MRVLMQSNRVWGVIVALWVWVVRGVRAEQVSVSQGLLNQLGIKLPTTGDFVFFCPWGKFLYLVFIMLSKYRKNPDFFTFFLFSFFSFLYFVLGFCFRVPTVPTIYNYWDWKIFG
jgi:hypothetical protein